ncbi:SDR family oxidoreductase [Paenibacillus sp. GCM10027626]|uniref:SDR family oxidoreductase n=1 Tax=Paenibacillus sp. GCM10027626 TaxID=3273411 RepID=UPI00363C8074
MKTSVLSTFSLEGKVALVTGGGGLYGTQIALALAEAGAITYVTTRDEAKLAELEQMYHELGCTVKAAVLDQSSEASMLRLRDRMMAEAGRVDILVNNAVERVGVEWDSPAELFAKSMEVNATGLFLMTRTFGDVMKEQGGGSIVNIGSIQGVIGPDASLYEGLSFHGFAPDYFFHKGGMLNFTRFTASYYGPYHVRCNCIDAGGVKSERTPDVFVERYSARTFLGRMANAEDLKGAIVFLASDASAYVTGANLAVDGGYTAK